MATLGSKSVGSIVQLNVNGKATNFIVVHQGNPNTSIYDSSCNGTWLLMKDCHESRQWHNNYGNSYSASDVNGYLNGAFLGLFDSNIQNVIKQVKIPYRPYEGYDKDTRKGSLGISVKFFLLCAAEAAFSNNYMPTEEGTTLSYFKGCAVDGKDSKRIGKLNGLAIKCWLRSPNCQGSSGNRGALAVDTDGSCEQWGVTGDLGLRPALILPSTLEVSSDGSVITNTPPTIPSSITVPTTVIGGQSITVSWGASTDSDSNLSGYILEQQQRGESWVGSWTQIYKGSARSCSVSVPSNLNIVQVQYRVKAYDSQGAESSYRTSDTRTVTNNRTPAISGSNSNLGSFSDTAPGYSYTVTDADGDAVTIIETLDGKTQRSYTVTLGAENTFTLDADTWQKILNGSHTLAIKATDSKGASATRTLTFTKAVTSISFEQTIAMPADDMPMKALLNIQGSFPARSILKVEICNNGNDEQPMWEDVTNRVLNGQKCYFANTEKTADSWGVKIRVNLSRGTATEPCYIQTLGGNFG